MTRLLSALPGIGNSVDSAAGLVFGAMKLVRNGIGVAAMLCLVLVGLIPLMKLALITLLHYAAAALAEPIADKRLTSAVSGAAEAIRLLLKLLFMAMSLFFLTVALICSVAG
jgi:stage III sporulation protein AE